MNLKSKIFGVGAAAVLAMSMTSGVLAEGPEIQVNLEEGECSVSVAQSNVDFGTLTYVDDQWVVPSGMAHDVDIDADVPAPNETCNVQISLMDSTDAYGLDNGAGGTIPGSNFNLDLWSYGPGMNSLAGPVTAAFQGASLNASIWLVSIPDTTPPGTYTGTLNVAISAAP